MAVIPIVSVTHVAGSNGYKSINTVSVLATLSQPRLKTLCEFIYMIIKKKGYLVPFLFYYGHITAFKELVQDVTQ